MARVMSAASASRVDPGLAQDQLHVAAVGEHQLLDEVRELDVGVAAQLARCRAAALKARWQVGFSRATSSLRLKTWEVVRAGMAALPSSHVA